MKRRIVRSGSTEMLRRTNKPPLTRLGITGRSWVELPIAGRLVHGTFIVLNLGSKYLSNSQHLYVEGGVGPFGDDVSLRPIKPRLFISRWSGPPSEEFTVRLVERKLRIGRHVRQPFVCGNGRTLVFCPELSACDVKLDSHEPSVGAYLVSVNQSMATPLATNTEEYAPILVSWPHVPVRCRSLPDRAATSRH
jgi:hypothetical protein